MNFAGLEVDPSVVAQYRLEEGSVVLSYDVDFANAAVASQVRSAQLGVATYLAALHGAERLPGELAVLAEIGTMEEYGRALDRLSPEPYATNLWNLSLSAARFADTVLDCHGRSAHERVVQDDVCVAGGFSGSRFERNNDSETSGFRLDSMAFTFGAERRLDTDWAIGFGLGYDNQNGLGSGRLWTSRNEIFQASAFLRRSFGDFDITALAQGGGAGARVRRQTGEFTSVSGDQDLFYVGGLLRGEQRLAAGGGTLRLRVDLRALQIESDAVNESGLFGHLRVNRASETMLSLRPGVEWSTAFTRDGYIVRPRVGVALTHIVSDPSPAVTASLSEVDLAVAQMRVGSEFSRNWAEATVGLDIAGSNGVVLGMNVFGAVSDGATMFGGSLQLRAPF